MVAAVLNQYASLLHLINQPRGETDVSMVASRFPSSETKPVAVLNSIVMWLLPCTTPYAGLQLCASLEAITSAVALSADARPAAEWSPI